MSQCEGMDQNALSFGEVGSKIAFAALLDTSGGFAPCATLVAKWRLVTLFSRCLFKRRRHSSRLSLRRSALGLITICSQDLCALSVTSQAGSHESPAWTVVEK